MYYFLEGSVIHGLVTAWKQQSQDVLRGLIDNNCKD